MVCIWIIDPHLPSTMVHCMLSMKQLVSRLYTQNSWLQIRQSSHCSCCKNIAAFFLQIHTTASQIATVPAHIKTARLSQGCDKLITTLWWSCLVVSTLWQCLFFFYFADIWIASLLCLDAIERDTNQDIRTQRHKSRHLFKVATIGLFLLAHHHARTHTRAHTHTQNHAHN